ncbi:helix-turn-helix domain-containing protein [Listeria booriae]|uniref:Mga helix-turn-helix domain-containing protein n=1 Tax=Listeria booriae TaxID=1552123 RepID=A0A7X0XIC7_9LIST|nr:helix-turn-helix domain-containing protein [Listeria booriae]MBC1561558.1 hypothetical protein [Listeria booriae]
MFLLLDTKEQLEINLINLLLNNEQWLTINEAAIALNSTSSKIYTAIQNITDRELDENLVINSQRNYGFIIDNKNSIDIDEIINKYIVASIPFKILDSAFQKRTNIKKFCIEHHISPSKFYRSAKVANSLLTPNQLNLNTKDLMIEGNEIYIREFMYYFYWDSFKGNSWPFETVHNVAAIEQIEQLSKKLHWNLNPFEYTQLAYRLAVTTLRYQRKNFVQKVPYSAIIPPIVKKLTSENLHDLLLSKLPLSIKKHEIDYLALIVGSYPWADAVKISAAPLVRWHKKKQTLPYRMTEFFVSIIKDNSHIDINDAAWLNLIHIHMYAISFPSLHVAIDLMSVYQDNYRSIYPEISANVDKLIDLIRTQFQEYPLIGSIYFSYYYTLFYLKYIESTSQKKLNIFLFINKDRVFVESIINHLQDTIPYEVTISTSIQADFEPDLVISNSRATPKLDVPIFYTAFPLSSEDIQRLTDMIKALI